VQDTVTSHIRDLPARHGINVNPYYYYIIIIIIIIITIVLQYTIKSTLLKTDNQCRKQANDKVSVGNTEFRGNSHKKMKFKSKQL